MNPSAAARTTASRLVWIAALCTGLWLSGCSSLPDWRPSWARFTQAPVRSDRFALPPAGTDVVGEIQIATASHEDTLSDLARRYDLGYEEIVAANPGMDPWLPGQGTPVVLPTRFVLPDAPREGLVLNLAAMRLFYYPGPVAGAPPTVITHPVGIGREGWETPQGVARITRKIVQPTWTVPLSVRREHAELGDPLPPVVPPGPDNPLGDFALRLSLPGYLIHGTNQPYGVGIRVSHGCVRLYPEDIARLFPEIPEGTTVTIVNQPYLAGWLNGQLYLEAHPPLAEDARRWGNSLEPMEQVLSAKAAGPDAVDRDKAKQITREARGIPIPVSPGSPDLAEILARAPRVPGIPPWAPADYGKDGNPESQRHTTTADDSGPAGAIAVR
jgi:L,D-transpeptidase ErfK/SrfK